MAIYKITDTTVSRRRLNLVFPDTCLSVKNGARAGFKIVGCLPTMDTIVPVVFELGTTTIPIYDLLGNVLYSDQLVVNEVIPGVWGTNPVHMRLCAGVGGRSQATPCVVDIPECCAEVEGHVHAVCGNCQCGVQ